jgi:transposase
MNAVGIDISKDKSMVCIMRPFGEVVSSPFEVLHTTQALDELAKLIESLDGETKVIMECTGTYYLPVAYALHEAGLFVSTIHAQIIHNFGNDTIRCDKTDKKDAVKIANYGLSAWLKLMRFMPEEDIRRSLKVFSRQYNKYIKLKVMLKNNFISLTDETFSGVNELFPVYRRKSDGHENRNILLYLKWAVSEIFSHRR